MDYFPVIFCPFQVRSKGTLNLSTFPNGMTWGFYRKEVIHEVTIIGIWYLRQFGLMSPVDV